MGKNSSVIYGKMPSYTLTNPAAQIDAAIQAAHDALVDTPTVVWNTGSQTISGRKTFVSGVTVTGASDSIFGSGVGTNHFGHGGATQNHFGSGATDNTFGDGSFGNSFGYNINSFLEGQNNFGGSSKNLFGSLGTNYYYSGDMVGLFSFDTRPKVNGTGVMLSGEASIPTNVVYQTGDQTISGNKTFSENLRATGANNVIGSGATSNSFGRSATSNHFGQLGTTNDFGYFASSNGFGNESTYLNFFGRSAANNQFGSGAANNTYYGGSGVGSFSFDTKPTVNGSGVVLQGDGSVYITGSQTISGAKSFVGGVATTGIGTTNIIGWTNSWNSFGSFASGNSFGENSEANYFGIGSSANYYYGGYFVEGMSFLDNVTFSEKVLLEKAPPASSTDDGTLGEIRVGSGYVYVATGTNLWGRVPLTNW